MRAFLAVAVLAASCGAVRTDRGSWERLKTRITEGAVPTSDDVELMINMIEDVPAARREVLMVMMGYVHGKKDGHLLSSYTADDDPLLSRVLRVETLEALLDLAVPERHRCERAKACDEVFLDLTVNLFGTIIMAMYSERHEDHADLNLLFTSRADDIITLTQQATDRARGTTQHEVLSMQTTLLRSLLTGSYEGLEDKVRDANRAVDDAERARARDADWARLMTRLDKGKQLRTNDVDLLFEVLEDSPDERGQIALNIRKYYVDALLKDPSGLLLIEDPLFTRLVEPATFKRLLQMASFEHKKCARANSLYELNCEQFRVELASLFGLLVVRSTDDYEFDNGGEADLAFEELRRSGFEALVNSHTSDIIALMDRAAEFASGTSQFDASKILNTVEVTRTILLGSREDKERIEDVGLSILEKKKKFSDAYNAARRAAAGQHDDLCPKSSASVHAWARTTAVFEEVSKKSCRGLIKNEVLSRLAGDNGWTDPHNGGTYGLTSTSIDRVAAVRITPDGSHTYTLALEFAHENNSCVIRGCSTSQVTSVADFSTNYCNLRNLYVGRAASEPEVYLKPNGGETVSTSIGAGSDKDACVSKASRSGRSVLKLGGWGRSTPDLNDMAAVDRASARLPRIFAAEPWAVTRTCEVSRDRIDEYLSKAEALINTAKAIPGLVHVSVSRSGVPCEGPNCAEEMMWWMVYSNDDAFMEFEAARRDLKQRFESKGTLDTYGSIGEEAETYVNENINNQIIGFGKNLQVFGGLGASQYPIGRAGVNEIEHGVGFSVVSFPGSFGGSGPAPGTIIHTIIDFVGEQQLQDYARWCRAERLPTYPMAPGHLHSALVRVVQPSVLKKNPFRLEWVDFVTTESAFMQVLDRVEEDMSLDWTNTGFQLMLPCAYGDLAPVAAERLDALYRSHFPLHEITVPSPQISWTRASDTTSRKTKRKTKSPRQDRTAENPIDTEYNMTLISLVIGFAAFFVVLAFLDLRIRGESFAARAERFRRGRALADPQGPVWGNIFRVAMCFRMVQINVVNYKDVYNLFGDFVHLLRMLCLWSGIRATIDWIAPGNGIWGRVGADALTFLFILMSAIDLDNEYIEIVVWWLFAPAGACVLIYGAYDRLTSGANAARAARDFERELELEAEREATTRARASQRGARPGLRKRANRGRRREATPHAPEPDQPETKSEPVSAPAATLETAAPEPKAPEPEPEPELEPTPVPVAEPRAPSAAPVPESKVEEPVAPAPAALEAKLEEPLLATEEPAAAPEGFEIVARVLEHLNEPHLLPIFVAEEINDNVLPCLDPSDLIGLGVSQMTCLTILGAAHSAAKNKKLETEDVLDNVAKHQSVLEEALREHREEIKRLRIRELPEDLCCPITCEIMKDPVFCVEDGHTYERVAIEEWFATGARTSPATSAELGSTALAPNHMARKLIAALLEEHRG